MIMTTIILVEMVYYFFTRDMNSPNRNATIKVVFATFILQKLIDLKKSKHLVKLN